MAAERGTLPFANTSREGDFTTPPDRSRIAQPPLSMFPCGCTRSLIDQISSCPLSCLNWDSQREVQTPQVILHFLASHPHTHHMSQVTLLVSMSLLTGFLISDPSPPRAHLLYFSKLPLLIISFIVYYLSLPTRI